MRFYIKLLTLCILILTVILPGKRAEAACGDGALSALSTAPAQNPVNLPSSGVEWIFCDLMLSPGDQIITTHTSAGTLNQDVKIFQGTATVTPITSYTANDSVPRIFTITVAGRYDVLAERGGGPFGVQTVRGQIIYHAPSSSDNNTENSSNLSTASSSALFQASQGLIGDMLADRVRILAERPSKPIKLARGEGRTGKSAGEEISGLSVWGDISASRLAGKDENDGFDGLVLSAVAGGDWQLSDQITLGAAIGLDHGRTETGQGGQSIESTQTGVSLSPYGIWQMDDIFSLSAIGQIGYSNLRAASDTEEMSQGALRASAELRGAAHLQYQQAYLLSELSVNYGVNHIAGTKTSLGNQIADKTEHHADLSLRLQPGYRFDLGQGTQLESYITGTYRYGFVINKQPLDLNNALRLEDRDDLRAGLGMRYIADGIAAGLEVNHLFLQEDYQDSRLKGSIEIKF